MYRKIKFYLIASMALFLLNCTPEDIKNKIEDTFDITAGDDFTAKVNGADFGANKDYVEATITVQSGIYAVAIAGGDLTGLQTGKVIGIGFGGSDYDDLQAGSTWDSPEANLGAEGGYKEDNNSENGTEINAGDVESIFIKVTAIDKVNHSISGEFNFVATDEDTGKQYTITNGKFTDITFILID